MGPLSMVMLDMGTGLITLICKIFIWSDRFLRVFIISALSRMDRTIAPLMPDWGHWFLPTDSDGCIILQHPNRQTISDSGETQLTVVA
jgi:hypothetical protein